MQRDTTAASSKVAAPGFKLIVVLAQTPLSHAGRKKTATFIEPHHEVSQSESLELYVHEEEVQMLEKLVDAGKLSSLVPDAGCRGCCRRRRRTLLF